MQSILLFPCVLKRCVGYFPVYLSNHISTAVIQQCFHRCRPQPTGQAPVTGCRRASSLYMTQDTDLGVKPGFLLYLSGYSESYSRMLSLGYHNDGALLTTLEILRQTLAKCGSVVQNNS